MRYGLLFCLVSVLPAAAAEFHVAPGGHDDAAGSPQAPFATVVRALKAGRGAKPEARTIVVHGGFYELAGPITLAPEDSGTADAPLLIRAADGAAPVLSGGRRLTGWRVGDDGRWRITLDEVKSGKWHFTQLFVNDQRRFRPRLPAKGYYTIPADGDKADPKKNGDDRMTFTGDEMRADWANLNDVEVLTYQQWTCARLPIEAVDTEKKTVRFFGHSPSSSSWGKFLKGRRYFIENVKEALGAPGSWYLDRSSGELTYVPLPGEDPKTAVVVAPRHERLLVIEGDEAQSVEHVRFEGLTLAHGAWPIPRTGQSIPQAEFNLDGVISATGARHITLQGCAVRHVGLYAMAFGLYCHDNTVERCEMFDLGAGGVKIGGAGLPGWGALQKAGSAQEPLTSRHTIRDCTIAHGGRLHPAAIGVWIGHSPHNVVEHNDIYDLYYSATSIGWVWGYRKSHAHHNRVDYNHMHTIGQGVLSDMGAVYTLGIAPGTSVSFNHIHDIHAFDYGGWGLYTDEGSTGVTMQKNLVYRTKTGGFHQHYGRDNIIVNNILAFSKTDQLQRSRVEEHRSFTFERNILIYDRGELFGKNWSDDKVDLDRNLYWNTAGPVKFPGGLDLEAWRTKSGHDKQSLVADPMFVDWSKDDYRLREGSPASKIGFEPFDVSKAGRLTPPVMTRDLPPVPRAFE